MSVSIPETCSSSETVVSLATPGVEFRSVLAAVEGATYHGHEGIRRYFADLNGSWEEWRNEIRELVEVAPNVVLADVHFSATGRGSGLAVERLNAVVFTLSEGKVATVETYATREDALEAARLRE